VLGFKRSLIVVLALVAVACSQQGGTSPSPLSVGPGLSAQGGSAMSATIQFGQPNVGSPFPPVPPHDQSAHAKDNLVPREVVIDRGGTVTFNTFGVHQVAIYAPGTDPGDIDQTALGPGGAAPCPPVPLINDTDNRIAVLGAQPCAGGPTAPTYTFTQPGRYLVICTFLPHFQVGMYGWVRVR
jgi:plastocyanin